MKAHLEIVKTSAKNSFTAFQYTNNSFKSPWHYHPEFEIAYIVRGSGVRYVGTTLENFTAGDLVLLGPNLSHCWKSNNKDSSSVKSIIVQWKKEFLGKAISNTTELAAIQDLLLLASKGVKFGDDISAKIHKKLKKLPELNSFPRLIAFLETLNELATTKDYRLLCKNSFTYNLDRIDSDRINKIQKYVEKNYKCKITLSDIASEVNLTEEYFSRYFSKIMGQPFFPFLNKYRINMACHLLIESDIQVAEICYDCGYDSLPHFYRQFKKLKGKSPLTYRNSYSHSFKVG